MGMVVAAGLMLAVSACGVDSKAMSVQAGPVPSGARGALLISQAATTTSAITTGKFAGSGSLSGSMDLSATVTGSFDRANQAAEATATLGPVGNGDAYSARFVTGIAYLQIGPISMLGIDTPWLSLDVAKLVANNHLGDLVPGGTDPSAGSNPDSFLDVLRGVSGEVTTVGQETIRGEPTTHYRASVLPSKALAQLPADHQAALRRLLGDELDKPIPVDVWLDSAGLVRKVSASKTIGSDGTLSGSFEFYDLGQPVTITPPAADQITRAEDLPLLKDLFGN